MKDIFQKQMNKELRESANMKQFFEILGKYYDLENCKPGEIVKPMLISQIPKIIMMVSAKPKKAFL